MHSPPQCHSFIALGILLVCLLYTAAFLFLKGSECLLLWNIIKNYFPQKQTKRNPSPREIVFSFLRCWTNSLFLLKKNTLAKCISKVYVSLLTSFLSTTCTFDTQHSCGAYPNSTSVCFLTFCWSSETQSGLVTCLKPWNTQCPATSFVISFTARLYIYLNLKHSLGLFCICNIQYNSILYL